MSQTRMGSLIEKTIETTLAFGLSVVLAPVFFKLNGIESDFSQNINIVICFTVLAIVRGYVVRRLFNKLTKLSTENVDN